jgi:signal transduction histidine kinase
MTDEVIITHATDAQEQKDEFISIVSHELRMPLTSIKGYAELLRAYGVSDNRIAEMTPARQRRYLSSITEQAEHLEVLIGDLLDMSRIQAGRLALRFTEVDVARLCRRVAELAQQRVDDEQYCIRCLLDEQLPLAWVDPDRLQQVLTNLLENAIKYSPDGGTIELLASASNGIVLTKQRTLATTVTHNSTNAIPTSITQLPSPELPMLHIMVRDQGIGISEQQQSLLFQPYSRLEHSATDRIPGVGLGLYIARKLVEAMHGRLTLQSSEGEGTCVSITLPGIPDGCHASSFH